MKDSAGNKLSIATFAEWTCSTCLHHLFVAVVSGTGDINNGTGKVLAGFEAQTPDGGIAVITVPDKSDMRAMPATATRGERERRDRAIESFEKLTIPQKFVLRWLLKHRRISRKTLIQFGEGVGFSDPDGYLNLIKYQDCQLIRFERRMPNTKPGIFRRR